MVCVFGSRSAIGLRAFLCNKSEHLPSISQFTHDNNNNNVDRVCACSKRVPCVCVGGGNVDLANNFIGKFTLNSRGTQNSDRRKYFGMEYNSRMYVLCIFPLNLWPVKCEFPAALKTRSVHHWWPYEIFVNACLGLAQAEAENWWKFACKCEPSSGPPECTTNSNNNKEIIETHARRESETNVCLNQRISDSERQRTQEIWMHA